MTPFPRWNLWTRLAAALLLVLPILIIFTPQSTLPKGRDVLVLVEIPSVADFLSDTAVIDYLIRSGAGGVVVRPSTLGGLLHGPDVSMASGAEILRLFRMESIANIWMWEQLKGRPIRPDAVYLFTNQLLFFESVLSALRSSFGENAARPYNDGEHDFGGGIPGNFIIEAFVSPEEISAVSFGLERNLRERLSATGLLPVIELSGAETPDAPADAAFLVTSEIAAQAAYRSIPGDRILLLSGVANPGWRRVTPAYRATIDTAIPAAGTGATGGAIVTSLSDAFRVMGELKASGVSLGDRSTAGAHNAPQAPKTRVVEQIGRSYLMLLVGVTLIATLMRLALAPLLRPAEQPLSTESDAARGAMRCGAVRHLPMLAVAGGVLLVAVMRFTEWRAEHTAAMLVVFFGLFAARRWETETPETRFWFFSIVAVALLLAGALTAAGRTPPDPWSLVLVTIALVTACDITERRVNGVFLPIVAILASGFVPWAFHPMALVMLAALLLPRYISNPEIVAAIRATLWPAGLVVLSLATITLTERLLVGGVLVGAAAGILVAEKMTIRHAGMDNSSSSSPEKAL